jgi:hypothetical protein
MHAYSHNTVRHDCMKHWKFATLPRGGRAVKACLGSDGRNITGGRRGREVPASQTCIALARVHELHSSWSIHLRHHRRFEPLRMHCARNNKRALSYTRQGSSDTVTAHAFVRALQSMMMMMMASPTPVHTTNHHPEPTSITQENSPSDLVALNFHNFPKYHILMKRNDKIGTRVCCRFLAQTTRLSLAKVCSDYCYRVP